MKKSRLDLGDSSIEIYHQGAHLSSWLCQGKEQLFLSRDALFEPSKAIRGGVPLCFPQFGAFGPGLKHGFARNTMWRTCEDAQANSLAFELEHDEHTLALWPHPFYARFIIELEENALSLKLQVKNVGTEAMQFTAALHSYFRVDTIKNCLVHGLQGCEYWDNGRAFEERNQQEQAELVVDTMIDRVYFNTTEPLILNDGVTQRHIKSEGFSDTVVWNPWAEGAKNFVDMADDEYQEMLCIESATVQNPTGLEPGETWQGIQKITLIKNC